MLDQAALRRAHAGRFGAEPQLFLAPGRVNLIGEHTDYAGGFVMPAAIDFATLAATTPRTDGQVVVYSENFGEAVEYALDALPAQGRHHWSDYPLGVLHGLSAMLGERGLPVPAFSLSLVGDVPLGAGLSSSASVEVAALLAILSLSGLELGREQMALLAQRAENTYVGANTGIMDQFIACCGAAHHALLLDCRSLTYRLAPIPPSLTLVIANTMVKHSHAGGEYNTRRAEVEEATRVIREHRPEVALLRDATLGDLEQWGHEMAPEALKRARHIISENLRTVAAAEALERGDLQTLGRLMAEAHASYRDDFEASAPEADLMVELANAQPGLVGARLTGGGFGGCTVNLVEQQHVPAFMENVARGYADKTGITPELYRCQAADAAHHLQ